MTYKLPTKAQADAFYRKAKAALDNLGFRPATPIKSEAPDGHFYTRRDLEIPTSAGMLLCSIQEDWLACLFDDVDAAKKHPLLEHNHRLNRCSGKWNWEAEELDAFCFAVHRIALPKGYTVEPVVAGFIWKNDTEGSWRHDTLGEAVSAAIDHATLS